MLDEQFRKWLQELLDREPAITQIRIAQLGKPAQGELSKLISGQVSRGFHLRTLEAVADLMGYPAWLVLWAVQQGDSLPLREPATAPPPRRRARPRKQPRTPKSA